VTPLQGYSNTRDNSLGPLLWLVDVWLEKCYLLDDCLSGPPALVGGRVAGDVSLIQHFLELHECYLWHVLSGQMRRSSWAEAWLL
jgi:hypothetical protein